MTLSRRALLQAAGSAALLAEAHAGPPGAQPMTAPQGAPAGMHPRELVFPADFGAHPLARTEWWYVTGALWDGAPGGDAATQAAAYGFQVTFFRSRTDVGGDHPSPWAARQLVFAHAAVTDVAAARLRHDQRIAREAFGLARAREGDTDVAIRDWSLQRTAAAGASRYRASMASRSQSFGIELQLDATQTVLLQGEHGYSRKGPRPGEASLYYSEPQLRAHGTLKLDGRARPVSGVAWLDHEWSDELLDPEAVGWDWIGMNLLDGSALTAFRLRRADGTALWAGGSWRPLGGATHSFGPLDVVFTPGRRWTSPSTHTTYPVEWTVQTPAGRFQVRPRADAQELDSRNSTGSIYWEGLSDLLDERGAVMGRGYLEMTGYASRLRL